MAALIAGLSYPLRALRLLARTPQLWQYVVVPILVNLLAGVALYLGLLLPLLGQIERRINAGDGALADLFVWTVRLLLGLTLAVGVGFVLVRFGVVLGAPWYAQLSEKLEALLTGRSYTPQRITLGGALGELWRAVQFEGKKLLLAVTLWLLSLLLLLIPVAGALLYSGAGAALGATIACLDFFDGPLERRRLGFRAKLAVIRRLLPASASFGLVAFALVSIPVVNLLAIPLCVTAGNLLVIEHEIEASNRPRAPR